MLKPINNHVLIEPLKHESFISSQKGNYEEIGIVLDAGETELKIGDKVYFDSWLIARYPDGKGGEIWLVKFEDIRAYED